MPRWIFGKFGNRWYITTPNLIKSIIKAVCLQCHLCIVISESTSHQGTIQDSVLCVPYSQNRLLCNLDEVGLQLFVSPAPGNASCWDESMHSCDLYKVARHGEKSMRCRLLEHDWHYFVVMCQRNVIVLCRHYGWVVSRRWKVKLLLTLSREQ